MANQKIRYSCLLIISIKENNLGVFGWVSILVLHVNHISYDFPIMFPILLGTTDIILDSFLLPQNTQYFCRWIKYQSYRRSQFKLWTELCNKMKGVMCSLFLMLTSQANAFCYCSRDNNVKKEAFISCMTEQN